VGAHDHVVVLLPGRHWQGTLGWGGGGSGKFELYSKYSALFGQDRWGQPLMPDSVWLAHELGHNFGLKHNEVNGDSHNLMDAPVKPYKTRLRYFQWKIINGFK